MRACPPLPGAGQLYGVPVTVRPLVRAGRRKTARWVRRAVNGTSEPDAIAIAHAVYRDLAEGVIWPHHLVLRWHLAGYLLPGVAVYRTLQTLGQPAPLAARAVGGLLARDALPRRRRLERAFRLPGSYALFAAAVRLLSPIMFPAPGWRIVWLEVSRDRVAFDIDRCYYLAALTALDAADLTPAYCHVDDILYDDLAPCIVWARTGTLAAGCARCDFRYVHTRPDPTTTAGHVPGSSARGIHRHGSGPMTRAVDGPLQRRDAEATTAGGRHLGRVRPYTSAGVFVDTWRATRAGRDALQVRQVRRLVDLARHARARSPFYAQHYSDIRGAVDDVRQLPPVTKPMLMDRFDEWVCDPAVTRTAVEAFTADPSRVGREFLGRYLVWTTSGTSGVPALLVQDHAALAVYTPVSIVRGYLTCTTPRAFVTDVAKVVARGGRIATLLVTGGHHGGAVMVARVHRRHPRTVHRNRLLSVLRPLEDLVDELNGLRPAVLHGYPSALTLLAGEQHAGRLHITPALMGSTGETLTAPARHQIETAFGCRLRDSYGSSEAGGIAFACDRGQLHVNTDWVIVEPVDRHHRPVEPGTASHTVLVTNLANRVQPVIRYDLGDSITWHPDPCPCGSPLPAITVHGRADEQAHGGLGASTAGRSPPPPVRPGSTAHTSHMSFTLLCASPVSHVNTAR